MSNRPVIIGAGINGLVAAAVLAAKGKRPVVLEALDRPGGAVRTEELTLPGFHHDVAAMNLSLFAGSPFMATHAADLARHGFDLVPIDRPFAQATAPGEALAVTTSRDELLAQLTPADRRAWEALEAEFGGNAEALGSLLGGAMGLKPLALWLWRSWRKLGIDRLLKLIRLLLMTPRAFLDETFEDAALKAALASWGMHLDFSPDTSGGAIFPYLEGLSGSALGMVIGKGGAGNLTRALVALIEENGGDVRCNSPVTAIEHANGRIKAVIAGERIETEAVLATLAPRHLARLIGESGNADFDTGLSKFTHAPGTMMIHLALDAAVPWLAESLRKSAYVHIGRSMDDMSLVHTQARAGLLPERPVLVVGQPTLYDPTRAPEGKHALWVQVRMLPAEIRGDAKGEITASDWDQAKEPYAMRVLEMIEAHAPGFQNHILARHIVSPLDLESENPNLVGGDQICGSHAISQNFIFRPVRGYPDGKTPIAGLRLIGAATWPGAGTGAASGFRAANDL